MENRYEELLGSFLKTQIFLSKRAADFSSTPDVALVKGRLDVYITTIVEKAAIAATNVSGTTEEKATARKELEDKCILVGAAAAAYCVKNKQASLKSKVEFSDTQLKGVSGKTLIANAKILFTNTEALKTQLADFGATENDVVAVSTLLDAFILLEEAPQGAIVERKNANVELDANFEGARLMLNDELDIYVKPYSVLNPLLYTAYLNSRAIDTQTNPTTADANITIQPGTIGVLLQQPYQANSLFTLKCEGPGNVRVSISSNGTTEGAITVDVNSGQKRQRSSSTLAMSGNYLVAMNTSSEPAAVKVWVE